MVDETSSDILGTFWHHWANEVLVGSAPVGSPW
jgi:hypothetical protein